ncbi:polysaccharide deacetylase family protein [Actinoplanes sp. NPDC000266]
MSDEPTAAVPPVTSGAAAPPPAAGKNPEAPAVSAPISPTADEATTALPVAEGPGEEETTALVLPAAEAAAAPGSAMPDEETAAIAASAAPDEETAAIAGSAAPDEETVALPASAAADERAPGSDETTVVRSAGAAAVTEPRREGEEATVPAVVVRPRTPLDDADVAPAPVSLENPVPLPHRPALTRRQLLIGVSGVAGAALVGGAVAIRSATGDSGAAPATSSPPSVAVTRPRTPESTVVSVSPAPVQHRAISTLAEYRQATGAAAFPADAIALTIDDGPHPVWTPKILRLLDKYDVPAMFCMIGNQVLGHEAVAQTVTRAGHQLANHTWSHPTKLAGKPGPLVRKQIAKAQVKIKNTTGYAPKLFRSPGGDWSPQLLREVAQAGLLPLDWTVDPRDWSRPGVNKIEHTMLAARPGQIILCHDGGGDRSQTYKALSAVLPALKARGLRFVAL